MAIQGRYFPGQTPSERIFLVLRRDVITYIAFLVIALIMLIPFVILIVIFLRSPDVFTNEFVNGLLMVGGSAYLLFILGLLLYGFIDYYLDVYIITDERIVDIRQLGLFKREIAELHLREVQDVSAKVDGFFPTLFHYGDVHIQTAGERENFVFYAVPHPYRVAKKIADLHESQIEQDRLLTEQNIEQGVMTKIQSPGSELNVNPADPRYMAELSATTSQGASASPEATQQQSGSLQDEKESEPVFEEYQRTPKTTSDLGDLSEDNSSRGMRDEEGAETVKASKTNVNAGLDSIDNYLTEVDKATPASGEVELKEGEIKKITDN